MLGVFLLGCGAAHGQPADSTTYPTETWSTATAKSLGMEAAPLDAARDYALSAGGAGMITRHGQVVRSWGDTKRKFDLKSSSKSIGVTALGLAIDDHKMKLDDLAVEHHVDFATPPESNRQSGWVDKITLRQLANQTAGFEKPGGYQTLLFEPGTRWHYSDGGPNWLAECVTLAMGQDIQSLMFQRVLAPIGIAPRDLHWRPHQYRDRSLGSFRRCEFGSGVHANVDAMARIGLLYLRKGVWRKTRLLSADFVTAVSRPDRSIDGLREWDNHHGDASQHYGLLWWNNGDGAIPGVPSDAFWSWGLHDSLIVVIPKLDIVVARTGKSWKRRPGENHYDVLKPFLQPIAASVTQAPGVPKASDSSTAAESSTSSGASKASDASRAPYPPSSIASEIRWDAASSIQRSATGSDNWPLTWMNDDSMMTAYGDGWGFEPKVEQKLSTGFARIEGQAMQHRGINVRSETGERLGQGRNGIKASGLLMVDDTLYLFARNADHSQLAWSLDRGVTWDWSDWKFTTSFGCPSFVNFGRNYEGAPDDFVYLVSPDSDSAYKPADRMVMARVSKNRLRSREDYKFFVRVAPDGKPVWSDNIDDRGSVFKHAGRCYRGGMTYNAGLRRYLWCQVLPESNHPNGPRFQGGFGIYDAPRPWGPWTTLYFTESWDVGPGESSSIPTKWISPDGRTIHLVFSGDDAFSVRRGFLVP